MPVADSPSARPEPEALVGLRVAVRWAGGKWYTGVVDEYNTRTGEHHVTYDDQEQKWYTMASKVFRVLGGEELGPDDLDDDVESVPTTTTGSGSVSSGSSVAPDAQADAGSLD